MILIGFPQSATKTNKLSVIYNFHVFLVARGGDGGGGNTVSPSLLDTATRENENNFDIYKVHNAHCTPIDR